MHKITRLYDAVTRSISPENFTGESGRGGMATDGFGAKAARDLGIGWKVSPAVAIPAGATFSMADISGAGVIQHIWMTATLPGRQLILRMYWDGQEHPSVECPLGDFFTNGWNQFAHVSSQVVCVNPKNAFNCYWEMPFRKGAKITLTNQSESELILFYQITYSEEQVPDDCVYFHAHFRRVNPVPSKEVYTIVDGIAGAGHYVGTYMAWGVNNNGWWGEGEVKIYIDDDRDYPTICGTGTEDYFGGAWNFDIGKENGGYMPFSTPYLGMPQVIRPDGLYQSQTRFGLYRWHLVDPIRFKKALRVTCQVLGWKPDRRYHPRSDDVASVAYWYQTLPSAKLAPLPDRDALEMY